MVQPRGAHAHTTSCSLWALDSQNSTRDGILRCRVLHLLNVRHNCRLVLFYPPNLNMCWKDQDRIPSTLVPSFVQRLAPAPTFPPGGGNECCSRFLLLVGALASVPPPTHGHRFGSLQCESRFALDTHWVDDIQVGTPFGRFGHFGLEARRTSTMAAPPLLPPARLFRVLATNTHSWASFR